MHYCLLQISVVFLFVITSGTYFAPLYFAAAEEVRSAEQPKCSNIKGITLKFYVKAKTTIHFII